MMVRPEMIRAAEEGEHHASGRIVRRYYVGNLKKYVIELADKPPCPGRCLRTLPGRRSGKPQVRACAISRMVLRMTDFKIASDVVEQFGNMIALRKTEEQAFPGIAQLFLASVLQCQPLAEVEVLASDGNGLNW